MNKWLWLILFITETSIYAMDDHPQVTITRIGETQTHHPRMRIHEADRMADPLVQSAQPYGYNLFLCALQSCLVGLMPAGVRVFNILKQTGLRELSLMYLRLTDTEMIEIINSMPPAVPDHLVRLSAGNNQLTRLPTIIRIYKQLRFLDLSNNCLRVFPLEICYLENLAILKIAHNPFVQLPEELCELIQLKVLDISYTDVSQLPRWIVNLTSLRALYVQRTFITSLPRLPDSLKILVIDRHVDISNVHSSVHIIRV